MSRELDARVARAMGWKSDPDHGWDVAVWIHPDRGVCLRDDVDGVPFYSTDIAAARTMEDWIEEHNLHLRYAMAMLGCVFILEPDPVPDCDEQLWWMLLHATPEQRCRAFLAAMEATCDNS